jgi:hypothetical protein
MEMPYNKSVIMGLLAATTMLVLVTPLDFAGAQDTEEAAQGLSFEDIQGGRWATGEAGSFTMEFTVDASGEKFVVQATDKQTILQLIDNYLGKNNMFVIGNLSRGDGGFNQLWSWHLVPDSVRMTEAAMELCDGRPSNVEENLDYWVDTVGTYCPWESKVVAINWSDNHDTATSPVPRNETSGGEVVVYSTWVQENETGGDADVFFAKSEDGGQTFGDPINLSSNEDWSRAQRIAVADNHVHVVWLDYDNDGPGTPPSSEDSAIVTVSSSDDGGETFDDAVLVGEPEATENDEALQIEATTTTATADGNNNNTNDDDSNVYISWVSDAFEEIAGNLNFAKSDDSGESFEVTEQLVDGVDDVEMKVVAAASVGDDYDDDNIYLAGDAASSGDTSDGVDQIFFQRSTDGGETFDDPIVLEDVDSSEGSEEHVSFESMEVDDDEIQETWQRYPDPGVGNEAIHFAVSTDRGETWG